MPSITGDYTDITYKLPPDFRYSDPSGVFSVCWLTKVLKGTFCFQLPGYGTKCTEGETKLTEGKEITCSIELGTEKAKFTYEHKTKVELERTWKHTKCEICQPTMCFDGTMVICSCQSILPWSDATWQVIQFVPDTPSNGKFSANCAENDKECHCEHTDKTSTATEHVSHDAQSVEVPTTPYTTKILRTTGFAWIGGEGAVTTSDGDILGRYAEVLEVIAQPNAPTACGSYYRFGVQDQLGRVTWVLARDDAKLPREMGLLSLSTSRAFDDATVIHGVRQLPMLAVAPALAGAHADAIIEVRDLSDDPHVSTRRSAPAVVNVGTVTTVWALLEFSDLPRGTRGFATLKLYYPDGKCASSITEPFVIGEGLRGAGEPGICKGGKKKPGERKFGPRTTAAGNSDPFPFPQRSAPGNPNELVTECRQIRVLSFDPKDATAEVTWRKKDGSGSTEPQALKSGDDAQISDCRCNNEYDEVTVKAVGGDVQWQVEECTP